MNLNKYTEKAQEAIFQAQSLASEYNHSQIEPEHLLLALVQQTDGVVPQIAQKLGTHPHTLQQELEQDLARRPKVYGATTQVGLSRDLQAVLNLAEQEAGRMRDEYVSTEHLLIALTDKTAGDAAIFLTSQGITRDAILRALTGIRGSQRVTTPTPESTYQALEKYGRDMTQLARQGKLDPVIGRDEEIRRVVQVLSRRTKNNPVLIFRPEFLNRIDEIIVFHSLSMEDLVRIVDIQLERLRGLLAERKISLELTEPAKWLLAEKGHDPVYGARPLKRTIQRELQDPLALKILEGEFKDGEAVVADVWDGELTFGK